MLNSRLRYRNPIYPFSITLKNTHEPVQVEAYEGVPYGGTGRFYCDEEHPRTLQVEAIEGLP